MIYTIRGKEPLNELKSLLASNDFQILDIAKNETTESKLYIEVPKNKYFLFCTFIGEYLSFLAMRKYARRIEGYRQPNRKRNIQIFVGTEKTKPYWNGLTSLLVSDYFSYQNEMNVDAFILFNMRKFKNEFLQHLKNYLDVCEKNEKYTLELFRKEIMKKNVDMSPIETIHVQMNKALLELRSKSGELIDRKFLKKWMPNLEIRISDDFSKPWMRTVMLLSSLCLIFRVKNVFVHKNVSKEIKQMILDEGLKNKTNLIFCKGCSRCDES